MEEEKLVRPKTRSSLLGMRRDKGSKEVPCNCLGYRREWKCDILGRYSDGSGAYYGSFDGNGDKQPNIVCESWGEVHRPESGPGPGCQRGAGYPRCRDWLGA